jgi:hypothetical protein
MATAPFLGWGGRRLDDRVPTLDEACAAIVYHADNDAYQPED